MNFSLCSVRGFVSPSDANRPAGRVCGASVARRLASLVAALLPAACGGQETASPPSALTIYSPAPPGIMLHTHNTEFGAMLRECQVDNKVVPLALPQSINQFGDMPAENKKTHLPIVTTIDFLPAVHQGGPEWHAYDKANADLKFVASLYNVAFGVLAFDESIVSPDDLKGKKIGAPPRASAVRVYTEALLRDGWGVIDDVEIVDIAPPDLPAAVANGEIDATTWNIATMTMDGLHAVAPQLLEREGAHWLRVDRNVVAAINAANDFRIESAFVETARGSETELLSFRLALAAWEATPDETVSAILGCMDSADVSSGVLLKDVRQMGYWPGLATDYIHPAAVEFYRTRGVAFE